MLQTMATDKASCTSILWSTTRCLHDSSTLRLFHHQEGCGRMPGERRLDHLDDRSTINIDSDSCVPQKENSQLPFVLLGDEELTYKQPVFRPFKWRVAPMRNTELEAPSYISAAQDQHLHLERSEIQNFLNSHNCWAWDMLLEWAMS